MPVETLRGSQEQVVNSQVALVMQVVGKAKKHWGSRHEDKFEQRYRELSGQLTGIFLAGNFFQINPLINSEGFYNLKRKTHEYILGLFALQVPPDNTPWEQQEFINKDPVHPIIVKYLSNIFAREQTFGRFFLARSDFPKRYVRYVNRFFLQPQTQNNNLRSSELA